MATLCPLTLTTTPSGQGREGLFGKGFLFLFFPVNNNNTTAATLWWWQRTPWRVIPGCQSPATALSSLTQCRHSTGLPWAALIACWLGSRTCPGRSASWGASGPRSPGPGPSAGRAWRSGFCASWSWSPAGLGCGRVPCCPLFVHGLALYGWAMCS